jgi:sialate O-acetylesterase
MAMKKLFTPVLFYKSCIIESDSIKIDFDHVGSGLMAKGGGDLNYFAIAGADRKFVWAEARIQNHHVVVWSSEIKQPVYVRYAWADNPEGANLYNIEGLPASPFEATILK